MFSSQIWENLLWDAPKNSYDGFYKETFIFFIFFIKLEALG